MTRVSHHIMLTDGTDATKFQSPSSTNSQAKMDKEVKVKQLDGTVNYVDKHAIGGDVNNMPPGYFRSPQFIGTLVAQCCASMCAYLGWVLPANTLTLINADLGSSPHILWVATAWTLSSCIGFLLVGRISDIFGRRWMVLSTSLLGLLGCILGSVAPSVAALIAANVANGLAAAGQLSFGIVMGELVPNRMRGPIVTVVFLSSLPFAVFGPIIMRRFIGETAASWRWSYYLGVTLNGVALVLYGTLYRPPTYGQLHVRGKGWVREVKELDWVGIGLFVGGCVAFLIGISWGGTVYPWKSAEVLCPLLIGVTMLAFFAFYEGKICKTQPLMPPRLFRNVGFVAIVVVATIGSMIYYSLTILWPQIIGNVYDADVISVGWQSCVVGGGVLLGHTIAGFSISYVPKVKIQTVIASVMAAAFMTSMASLSPDRHDATLALGTLTCICIGFVENITFPGVTLVWEPQDIGLATGVLGSIRGLGGAVAQALYLSVYFNKLKSYIPTNLSDATLSSGLPESSLPDLLAASASYTPSTGGDVLDVVPGMTNAVKEAVTGAMRTSYVGAFRMVFYATVPFSVLLVGAAFFVPNMERFLTRDVAKRLQGVREEKREVGDRGADEDKGERQDGREVVVKEVEKGNERV